VMFRTGSALVIRLLLVRTKMFEALKSQFDDKLGHFDDLQIDSSGTCVI